MIEEYKGKKVNIPDGWEIPTNLTAASGNGLGSEVYYECATQSIYFADKQSKYALVLLKNTGTSQSRYAYIDRQGNVTFYEKGPGG